MIHIHRKYVRKYTAMCGILRLGIKHDLSKYHPEEFFEGVKYYTGHSSPVDECRKLNGVSYARLHHKGRNKHHYEYWIDEVDGELIPIKMPYKYAVEMICDFLSAGRAYHDKSFTYQDELNWWNQKLSTDPIIHPQTKLFVSKVLEDLCKSPFPASHVLRKDNLKMLYEYSQYWYNLKYKNKEV